MSFSLYFKNRYQCKSNVASNIDLTKIDKKSHMHYRFPNILLMNLLKIFY